MPTLAWVLLVIVVAALLVFDLKAVGAGRRPVAAHRSAVVRRLDRVGGGLHRRARSAGRR